MLSSLILCNKNEPFLNWIVMCEGNGYYMTTSDNQFSGWTKRKLQSTPQSHTCTKKGSQSLFGGLLPIWSTTTFWILAKQLALRSMLLDSHASPVVHRISSKVVPHWLVPELALWDEALSLSGVQILEAETVTTSPATTRDCRSSLSLVLSPCNLS